MRTRHLVPGLTFALAFLISGCGDAPPPPPPGATVEQLRAVADAADAVRMAQVKLETRVAALEARVEQMRKAEEEAHTKHEAAMSMLHEHLAAEAVEASSRANGPIKELRGKQVPAVAEGAQAPLRGQVLAADSAMDIYLVSIGSKDGIKVADELTVFRGSSFVAVVIVDQVFHDKASVVVKKVDGKPVSKSPIKTGDRVSGGVAALPPPEAPPESVKGHVLAADSEKDVYLVSVGKKDGVVLGDELTVFRGDSFVAVVVVDTVFEDKASVVVKKLNGKAMKKSEIKAGDKVATAL